MNAILKTALIALACAALWVPPANAQQPGGERSGRPDRGGQGPDDGGNGQRPPRPPVDTALDVNGDHFIDAGEISRASTALLTLDANGDGQLSEDECLPQPPGQGGRTAPPGRSAQGRGDRPSPPIFTALDTDGNGVIGAAEISAAATALLSLDQDGDGQLSPEECRPQHPGGQQPSDSRRRR